MAPKFKIKISKKKMIKILQYNHHFSKVKALMIKRLINNNGMKLTQNKTFLSRIKITYHKMKLKMMMPLKMSSLLA